MSSTIVKNSNRIPKSALSLLEKHTSILSDILFEKLVGVYLHGSAAMGGFSWEKSDIDYLAVIAEPLTPIERRQLSTSFLEICNDAPAKGIEMSVVLERFAGQDFRYPTPYEFHFGTEEQIRLHGSPHTDELVDPDLAAHFTIVKYRGLCIYGKPIDDVFADVPKENYLHSIIADAEESFRNIQNKTDDGMCRVPTYAVLNFCRVLAYVKQKLITSKLEGAEWSVENVPTQFQPIILAARSAYTSSEEPNLVSGALLKQFAVYARANYFRK